MNNKYGKIGAQFHKKIMKAISEISSEKFAKRFILETNSLVYYSKDFFRSSVLDDVLKHNGIKKEDAIIVEHDSNYGRAIFNKYVFDKENKFMACLSFIIGNKPSGGYYGNLLETQFYKAIIVDRDCNFYYWVAGYYDRHANIEEIEENLIKSYERVNPKSTIRNYRNIASDIDAGIIRVDRVSSYHILSDETIEMAKNFFRANGVVKRVLDEFNSNRPYDLWEVIRTARFTENKSNNSREKLLNEVFQPAIDEIKEWIFDSAVKTIKGERSERSDGYWRTLVRDKEWLIYVDSPNGGGNIVFYNTNTKKKYMIQLNYSYLNNEQMKLRNIGIFNMDRISIDSKSKYYYHYSKYDSYYEGSIWKTKYTLYDNYEYVDNIYMYNINGEPISYKDCFAGTISENLLEYIQDIDFFPSKEEIEKQIAKNTTENYVKKNESHKIKDITDKNMVPSFLLAILFLKEEYRLTAEQLIKSRLINIVRLLTSDQNAFVESKENCNQGYYNEYDFFKFNKGKNNLKDGFNMSINNLRVIDEFLGKCLCANGDAYRDNMGNFPMLHCIEMLIGQEKMRCLDSKTLKEALDLSFKDDEIIFKINGLNNSSLDFIRNHYTNLKSIFEIISKIDNTNMWGDYLRMKNQLMEMKESIDIPLDMKQYKVIPDKSTKFVALRPKQKEGWHEQNGQGCYGFYIESPERQYIYDYKTHYSNTTPIYDGNKLVGVILEMDTSEHIRYLHDELTFWINFYRDKARDELFGTAAKRVNKYEWSNKDIIIMAPKKANDVAEDAKALQHCAASFIDPIINGTENIMFIRKKDMPTVPWYTMAIDNDGNIEQIHNLQNGDCSVTDQLRAYQESSIPSYAKQIDFVPMLKKWAKEVGINPDTIRYKYGALGANR